MVAPVVGKGRPGLTSRQGSCNLYDNSAQANDLMMQNLMVAAMLTASLPHLKLEFTIFGRFALSFESTLALILSGIAVVAPKVLVPLIIPGAEV
jgi:hypothetical protein